jgi:sugar O-acyltransferase (sialic acid O-acetyltransferase NeuD family)
VKQVILAGNAITAEILYGYIAADSRYKIMGLTVDDEYAGQGGIQGLTTIPVSHLNSDCKPDGCVVIMAMGYNDLNMTRESMYMNLKEMGYIIETYIHPDARIFTVHQPGEGSVILPGAVVEPHAQVGANTMVWCNVTLAHHSRVADHCWIASGAVISGQAHVGHNSFIGVNATVVNKVNVAEYNIIGGGALITKDTKPSSVHLARSGEELRFSSQDYVKYYGI